MVFKHSLTERYCRKCAHPHAIALTRKDVVLKCPSRGCLCRKFIPLPLAQSPYGTLKVASLMGWKVAHPPAEKLAWKPPTTPAKTRKNKEFRRLWLVNGPPDVA